MTKDFLKLLFNEEKDLMFFRDIKWVNVPQYDELSVLKLWPQVKKRPELAKYFPDKLRQGQTITGRTFSTS